MKRIHLAYLTILLACGLVGIVITRAHAQTGSPAQWSTIHTSGPLSSCPTPGAGLIIECAVTNVGIEESVNGGLYVPVNQLPVQGAKGDTGPAGPAGATGAAGPQGPAGPAATNPVTSVNGKTGAVVISLQ
jgi:hypothetical protein